MDITLANFQIKAIADLTEAMEQPNRDFSFCGKATLALWFALAFPVGILRHHIPSAVVLILVNGH